MFRDVVVVIQSLVMSDTFWSHRVQHTRLPYPSPSPGACSNSYLLSPWCQPAISFSKRKQRCLSWSIASYLQQHWYCPFFWWFLLIWQVFYLLWILLWIGSLFPFAHFMMMCFLTDLKEVLIYYGFKSSDLYLLQLLIFSPACYLSFLSDHGVSQSLYKGEKQEI